MRKVILLEHISLDGFMAGPKGEMDWIRLDEAIWGHVEKLQETADAAIYGAKTFKMMEYYWPTAAEQAGASEHDINHSRWVNAAQKIVFSRTLNETAWANTTFVRGTPADEIAKLKQQPGQDMLLIGSASLASTFIREGLVDEYWLNLNPVVLGGGTPLFQDGKDKADLKLLDSTVFPMGSIGLHYARA